MSGRRRRSEGWVRAAVTGAVVTAALVAWSPTVGAEPGPGSVTVTVGASADPSQFGLDVTYTAVVVTSDGGNLAPFDTIWFEDDGGNINGCSAQSLTPTVTPGTFTATCDQSGSDLSVGTHAISAVFGGDGTYGPANGSMSEEIDPGATTTMIDFPAPGASLPYGDENQNSFNVTVAAASGVDQDPSGNVTFYSGVPDPSTYLCSTGLGGSGNGQSNGSCYLNSAPMDAGTYQLTAVYSGDGNFAGSTATQALTIDQVQTQMNVFAVPGYAFYGAEDGNFFIVGGGGGNGGSPTGYFDIAADGTSLVGPTACSAGNGGGNPCYIDSATALPASTTPYTVTVSYPGDVNFTPASDTVSLRVFPATTTTTLAVSPSAVTFGREGRAAISVTVRSGTTGAPTGVVEVQRGGRTLCTVSDLHPSGPDTSTGSCPALGAGQLATGDYDLTADYQGDGNYQSSVSAAQTLTVADQGYWMVGSNGAVYPFGSAPALGSVAGLPLSAPIVGIASTPDGGGYWEVGADGGVFAFGDAGFYGSMGAVRLTQPIVGIASTPDGGGYWEVGADCGVFAFGDAGFYGSMGGVALNRPIVGIASDPATGGYWLVASDGGIFSFDAPFLGSTGAEHLNAAIVGMAAKPDGGGYWEVGADGGVFAFGDAPFLGSLGGQLLNGPIVAVSSTADGGGYRMAGADGGIFTFGDAEFDGSLGILPLLSPIVGLAG